MDASYGLNLIAAKPATNCAQQPVLAVGPQSFFQRLLLKDGDAITSHSEGLHANEVPVVADELRLHGGHDRTVVARFADAV